MSQQLGALPYQNIVSSSSYAPQQGPLSTTFGALAGGQEAAAAWGGNQPNAAQQPGGATPATTPYDASALPSWQTNTGGANAVSPTNPLGGSMVGGTNTGGGNMFSPNALGGTTPQPYAAGAGAGQSNLPTWGGGTNTGGGNMFSNNPWGGGTNTGGGNMFSNNPMNTTLPKRSGGLIGGYQGGGYVPGIVGVGRGMGR